MIEITLPAWACGILAAANVCSIILMLVSIRYLWIAMNLKKYRDELLDLTKKAGKEIKEVKEIIERAKNS